MYYTNNEKQVVFFLWVISGICILCANISVHSVCSIFKGNVKKKNNWDETARVFTQVKVWIKRSLGHSEGEGMGRGCVLVEKQDVEGNSPKWRGL
jgi:hypothetical protein